VNQDQAAEEGVVTDNGVSTDTQQVGRFCRLDIDLEAVNNF
jgi:hypothetical protein